MNKPNIKPELTTLKQVDQSSDIRSAIDRDFGSAIEDLNDGVSRRRWLQIMGASLALGGVSGCRWEEEKIAPFAFRPQNRIPGIPDKFSAVIDFAGYAQPLLATCYDGRPIKLDGNPDHPSVQGASTTFTQASILNLYDPDRLRSPIKPDTSVTDGAQPFEEATWEDVLTAGKKAIADPGSVAIISEQIGSPTMARIQSELVGKGVNWFTFSAVNEDNSRAGAKAAFGKAVRRHVDFENAKVVVSIDADPLKNDPDSLTNSLQYAAGRDADHGKMNRLYVVESQYTTTGGCADHRISVPSSKIAGFVGALAKAIENTAAGGEVDASLSYRDKVLACMAQDLKDNAGSGAVICGERQPAEVHAAVHAINQALGNNGKTVTFTACHDAERPTNLEDLKSFVAGSFKSLIILGGNPVFGGPASLKLAEAISKIENSIHITSHRNETSNCCKLVSDVANQMETWSDGWAYDGSVCIGQPLILPLFGSKSETEILSEFAGVENAATADLVKATHGLSGDAWAKAVHDGFIADSQAAPENVSASSEALPAEVSWKSGWDESSYEIVFNSSESVYDGRFANNAWLQELPDFITKLTWGNAAALSPKTAEKLGVETGQTINIGELGLPVVVVPGQADGSIGLTIGYGRTECGLVGGNIQTGQSVGIDVTPLRSESGWNFVAADAPTPTAKKERMAMVQEPWDIDDVGRDEIQNRMFRDRSKKEGERSSLIREGTYASYEEFLAHNPHDDGGAHAHDEHSSNKAKTTAVPAAYSTYGNNEDGEHADDTHGHTEAHGDEHGHGHEAHHWPEAFHLHHKPFDITPGARMDYTSENPEYKNMWGMSIDLNKCTGCNACVIACQSENNVPIVGKDQVIRGREMHWMRMDRYFGSNLYSDEAADSDDKQIAHQPVTCQHCENAPCETVCPVAATVHSHEGLNSMVYNRCIGTRYCGNNCPYKVRRFNYFNYADAKTFLKYPGADKLTPAERNVQNLMVNPEVTIRSRGVMEKCTYCVQRIMNVKIKAKADGNRDIGPNEVTTACQDVCPTKAIKFGDINNTDSDVRKAHDNARSYTMLEELNNYPRTKYLARVRNPHPALVDRDDRNSVRGKAKADPVHADASHNEHAADEVKTEATHASEEH